MENGALGMGHWEWGIGHRASGIGHRAVSFFVGAIPREEPQSLKRLQIVDGEGRHGGTTPTKPWFP